MLREPRQRNTVGCNTSGLGGWPVAPDVLLDRREELELFGIFGQHQNAWCMIVRIPREAGRRRGWDPRLPGLHVRLSGPFFCDIDGRDWTLYVACQTHHTDGRLLSIS